MGRLVKCEDTGEKKPVEELFCVKKEVQHKDGTVSSKNHYYSSEEKYKEIEENKKYWNMSIDLIMEILCYENGMKFPPVVSKKLSELSGYGNKVIYESIYRTKLNGGFNIMYSKDFSNEYNKISYLFAIICNEIKPVYDEFKRNESAVSYMENRPDFYKEISIYTKKRRKSVRYLLGEL